MDINNAFVVLDPAFTGRQREEPHLKRPNQWRQETHWWALSPTQTHWAPPLQTAASVLRPCVPYVSTLTSADSAPKRRPDDSLKASASAAAAPHRSRSAKRRPRRTVDQTCSSPRWLTPTQSSPPTDTQWNLSPCARFCHWAEKRLATVKPWRDAPFPLYTPSLCSNSGGKNIAPVSPDNRLINYL